MEHPRRMGVVAREGALEASMPDTKISEIMSPNVQLVSPDDTIQTAAQKMHDADVGFLPIGEKDKLIGMITDRDITIRAVAEGKDPSNTKVRDVMTDRVLYCTSGESIDAVAENMAEMRVRRFPVVNEDKKLVGVISLGDIAFHHKPSTAGAVLASVCHPEETKSIA